MLNDWSDRSDDDGRVEHRHRAAGAVIAAIVALGSVAWLTELAMRLI
ncbi:MAG: hypothetical protein WBL20_14315 [Sphingobium sp.]